MNYQTTISGTLNTGKNLVQETFKSVENPCAVAYRFGFNGQEKDDEWTGTTGSQPIVREYNHLMDNNTGYGKAIALYADFRPGATSYLFMRRNKHDNNTDSTMLICFPITRDSIGSAKIVARFKTRDISGEGDIQISPDGKYVGISHYRSSHAFIKGDGQIILYNFTPGNSNQLLTQNSVINFNYYTICINFDFSLESKYMYISTHQSVIQIMGPSPVNIYRVNLSNLNRELVVSGNSGEIRRGKDGSIYVCTSGTTKVKKITNADAATPVATDYTVLTESGWQLSGTFPIQPHRLYPVLEVHYTRHIGDKRYELTDHLGNVRIVITDVKEPQSLSDGPHDFVAELKSANDYYPFGMLMPGRNINPDNYRFGFNGQEKDDEIIGVTGSHYTAQFWEYDSRIGRRWNIDPVTKPHESPFACFANNPIWFIDPNGADTSFVNSNCDYDKQAKKDFTTAYDNVKTRIANLNTEISGYEKQLASGDLNKRQTRKINNAKSAAERTLNNWEKLETDFDNIINDPNVTFNYSSNTDILRSNENGLTGGSISRNDKGEIVGGTVNINIRPGHDESVIHENRHGNQVLNGTNNRPALERERDAFIYQRVYNYSSVQKTIENARIQKYGIDGAQMRPAWGLDDMINYLYGD